MLIDKETSMSATEIPVLDPKNIISKTFIIEPESTKDDIRSQRYNRTYEYDPVARIMFTSRDGQEQAPCLSLYYNPNLDEDFIYNALYDDDVGRMLREAAKLLYAFFKISHTPPEYYFRGPQYSDDIFYGYFSISGELFTAGFDDQPCDFGATLETYPGYEFWPPNLPGRGKALASYFPHFALLALKEIARQSLEVGGIFPQKVGVVVDAPLAEKVGLENFPDHQIMPDDNVILLTGG
jgi:hypothetical protein